MEHGSRKKADSNIAGLQSGSGLAGPSEATTYGAFVSTSVLFAQQATKMLLPRTSDNQSAVYR